MEPPSGLRVRRGRRRVVYPAPERPSEAHKSSRCPAHGHLLTAETLLALPAVGQDACWPEGRAGCCPSCSLRPTTCLCVGLGGRHARWGSGRKPRWRRTQTLLVHGVPCSELCPSAVFGEWWGHWGFQVLPVTERSTGCPPLPGRHTPRVARPQNVAHGARHGDSFHACEALPQGSGGGGRSSLMYLPPDAHGHFSM